VRVDDIGIGHNFGLHLREPERFVVELVNVSLPCQSRPQWYENDPVKRFANQKAQFYQSLADAFEHDQIDGLTDDETIGQLADIMYETDSHGRMEIEPKEKARQRGVRSPDRAKVTGGCSAVNATVALRDFDEWAEWGNDEWSFAKILPFYRKLENDRDYGDADFHGTSGPILIKRATKETWQPLGRAFSEACGAVGFADVIDHNDPASTGIGPIPRNRHDRVRISTAIGYLASARHRLNLTIRPDVNVHHVLVEGDCAIGIEAECGSVVQNIRRRRITLSAGAINSPAILMRSGIGPRTELEELGIRTVADLSGVGRNLIDHPGCG
jgi:choline dehydrogenase-like flavoprotein